MVITATFTLDLETVGKLTDLSKSSDLKKSEIVRQAIGLVFDNPSLLSTNQPTQPEEGPKQ